jgi:hypothetical protein
MQRLVAVLTSSSVPAVAGAGVLQRLLWQWLVVGLLITACFPAARGVSEVAGVLPLWWVGAPVASLLVFHRSAVAAAWRLVLVRTPRRRRPRHGGSQAKRIGFGRGLRQQPARAA